MSAEQFVLASYRGLQVGERLKLFDFGPTTAHLELQEPLLNGTALELKTDGGVQIPVTVVRVHEKVADSQNVPGMRVRANELTGAAKDWWTGLVSIDDPVIPEPAMVVKPSAEREPEPEPVPEPPAEAAAPEAVPEQAELQVTKPIEGRNSTKKTMIMNVSEIQAAIAKDEPAGAVPKAQGDGSQTVQMSQEELKEALEKEKAALEDADGDDSRSKKKRRRRKKKR